MLAASSSIKILAITSSFHYWFLIRSATIEQGGKVCGEIGFRVSGFDIILLLKFQALISTGFP